MTDATVLVAGAGPVGATCALALARGGVPVALLERAPAVPLAGSLTDDTPLELRVSALSAGAVQLLEALGVWARIAPSRASAYTGLEVWEDGATLHFDSASAGAPTLGAVVENRALVAALHEALAELPGVLRLTPGSVHSIAARPAGLSVTTTAGSVVSVQLAVAAEGMQSPLRAVAGIPAWIHDFDQSALVTHVRTALAHRRIAYQRFLPDGPLALLPLPDGRASVVWSTRPAQARMLAELPAAEFCQALASASAWRLGDVLEVDARLAVPLRGLRTGSYYAGRVALAGDAAHVVHPLAGLGATLGLADAASLAELAVAAYAAGQDVGGAALLRRYARWRSSANTPVSAGIGALHRLFGVRTGPLPALRRAGMVLTEQAGPLKALLVAHASALSGDLPALMRGAAH